jgi:hypothetical protein
VDLNLWQSSLYIGLEQHRWPVSFVFQTYYFLFSVNHKKENLSLMAKTDNFEIWQQYLTNYIRDIKKQIDQYQMKLRKQSALCPVTSVSFERIDHCLKEYVDCQRKHLTRRNNNQLLKFKDDLKENELFKNITTYYPTVDQVSLNSYFQTINFSFF